MGHQHIVHVTHVTMLQKERRRSLSLQRCGHLIRQIWIRWTTASGICFKRGSTRGSIMWRSWKNVCWGSGGCWTMHTVIAAAITQWCSRLNACVRVNGGHFEHKLWASDFLLCFACVIDTGCPKCDRYKHVQSANIVWNVLLLCLRLSHGMVATQQTYGKKFLRQWLWHSLVKLCTKNYENPSIFLKVTAKKSVAPFFWTRCIT